MKLDSVMFFGNGNFAAFRGNDQVPEEQGSAWLQVLQDKLDRGVVDHATKVAMPGWWTPDHESNEWTVADLVKTGHLKERGKTLEPHESVER